jgi:hypothetical protein
MRESKDARKETNNTEPVPSGVFTCYYFFSPLASQGLHRSKTTDVFASAIVSSQVLRKDTRI